MRGSILTENMQATGIRRRQIKSTRSLIRFFVIPSSLTAGKEKIRIRIENESLFPWAEVSYQICPLADGPQEDFLSDDVYALLLKNGSVVVCDGRLIIDSDRKNAHPFRLFTCGEKKYIVCGKSGKLVCATESGIKLCNYAGELPEGSCWTLERCGQGWDLRAENGKYLTFEIGSAAFKEEGSLNFIPFGKRVDCDY